MPSHNLLDPQASKIKAIPFPLSDLLARSAGLPDEPRPLAKRLRAAFGLLVALTALAIAGLSLSNARLVANELLESLASTLASQASDRTTSFLTDIEPSLRLGRSTAVTQASVFGESASFDAAWPERARLLVQILRSSPNATQVYFGDRQGRLVLARINEGVVEVETATGNMPTRWRGYILDEKGRLAPNDITPIAGDNRFDARKRDWYTSAQDTDAIAWSSPYRFARRDVFGVSASVRLVDPNTGRLLGVLGLDFETTQLSDLLRKAAPERQATIVLVDANGRILAHPNPGSVKDAIPGQTDAAEAGDPLLAGAIREIRANRDRTSVRFESNDVRYLAAKSNVPIAANQTWQVIAIVPESQIAGLANTQLLITTLVCLVLVAISLYIGNLLARRVTEPLRELRDEMADVGALRISNKPLPRSNITEINAMSLELEKLKTSVASFQKYAPKELVQQIVDTGEVASLGIERADIAVLFADVIGFSRLSIEKDPEELAVLLNRFFATLEKLVTNEHGLIDKFGGDSLMALWNTPAHPCEKPGAAAIRASLAYVRNLPTHPDRLRAGLGVHFGTAVVGNIGTEKRINYTAIGDTVNLADRIEELTRSYRVDLIVSEDAWKQAEDHILGRELDAVIVRGRNAKVTIVEPIALLTEATDAEFQLVNDYNRALQLYREKQFSEAARAFADILIKDEHDGPSTLLLKRCLAFEQRPPRPDWNGVTLFG